MKARSGARRPRGEVQADINVTPLVDVVLVLLIIFMVVGPAIAQGVPVQMPRTRHHGSKPDDGRDVVVAVTKDGQIFLAGNPVPLDEVTRLVERERTRTPDPTRPGGRGQPGKKVYLKADKQAEYGRVRMVMEAIRKASVEDVLLGTEQVQP